MTPSMQRMLWDVKLHNEPLYSRVGRAESGSARGTLLSLRRKGLLTEENKLTDEGRKMVEVEWRDAPENRQHKRGPKP